MKLIKRTKKEVKELNDIVEMIVDSLEEIYKTLVIIDHRYNELNDSLVDAFTNYDEFKELSSLEMDRLSNYIHNNMWDIWNHYNEFNKRINEISINKKKRNKKI